MAALSWAQICQHSASANGIDAALTLHCTSSSRMWLHSELSVQEKLSVALPGTAHDKSLAGAGGAARYPTPTPRAGRAPSLTPGTAQNKFPQPHALFLWL